MPVETLPFTSSMPFRILHKGPDYFRRRAEPGARKLSAVERLEADKAKYVKSQQVALTRQAPIIRKPLVPPGVMLHIGTPPARKLARWPAGVENEGWRRGPALNLDILNNLINDVCDGPPRSSSASPPSSSSQSSGAKSVGLDDLRPPLASSPASSCASSPLNNHLLLLRTPAVAEPALRPPHVPPPPVPPRGGGGGSPNSVTVRRVDVRPQEVRRPPGAMRPRQTAQGQVARPQGPPPPPPPTQTPPPGPLPVRAAPPASPAFTRVSSASSRGSAAARRRPALHRSKSDLSDRYSRATADLERFFNYCGLDPRELEGLGGVERFARANSDIVSAAKLRSASTPSSDCGGDEEDAAEEEEEEGGAARPGERAPYGISVIERNARVIKWLYGIRQARDANSNAGSGV